ncbi:MAG: flagellar filament capping protein FliD [Magnetococcales bacterium]|nr:flagellar filament capping protein FliD [Magnetococcales bacterium]
MALGNVTFGGLASGLPSDIVDQLVAAQQTRLKDLQQDKAYYNSQKSAFGDLKTKLLALETKATELQDVSAWAPHTATSSDSDKVAITADSTASAGYHVVEVSQLATHSAQIMKAAGGDPTKTITSTDTLDAGSTFSFYYNGKLYDSASGGQFGPLAGGETLQDLANMINAINWSYGPDGVNDSGAGDDESGKGVSASVLNDGTSYRLMLVSKDTGLADTDYNGGVFTDNGAGTAVTETPALGADGSLNEKDQRVLVNSANLSFNTAAKSIVTADFERRHEGIGQNAALMVNGVSVSSKTNTVTGVLTGVTLSLKDVTAAPVTISIENDKTTMKETLESFTTAFNDIIDYINSKKEGAFQGASLARGIVASLRNELNTPTAEADLSGDALTPYSLLAEIGLRTDSKTGKLSFDSTTLDTALDNYFDAVKTLFTNTQTEVGTGNKPGLAYRMETLVESITNSTDGSLTGKTDGLDSRITRLNDSIEKEQKRLERVREQLTLKFSNLEQMINNMNGSAGSLQSTLAKL